MLYELLPDYICRGLSRVEKGLCEIRLRLNMPIVVNVLGEVYYLSNYGLSDIPTQAIVCSKNDIEYVISKASNNSFYSINDQLINGYISYHGGIRIGVAGEFVYVNGEIKTVKNIQALNIRIPHEVNGCSLSSIHYLESSNGVYNTLILSPAGAGKTTYIRDLAQQIIKRNTKLNILIVDERCEITGISNGITSFNYLNCDVLSNCKKDYAFDNGIRSLRPDIIITDELSSKDVASIAYAITCGVKVIATIHADNVGDLKNKLEFSQVLENKMFDRFVVLGCNNRPGELVGVYNADLECIGI